MNVRFQDPALDRLEADSRYDGGFPQAIVKAFRRRMQQIRAAPDERVFYELKSLRFHKLKGKRSNQHSIWLNDQWRLIIEFDGKSVDKTAVIVTIEDYH